MAPRIYPWSKNGRRSSESIRPGERKPLSSDANIGADDMIYERKRPPPLRLIMPTDSKASGCSTPSLVLNGNGVESTTDLALTAHQAVAAVNKLIRCPGKVFSPTSEPNQPAPLIELPASFVQLNYPKELPVELPGSLMMQNEGFASNSLMRWGRGPEKLPRTLAASLVSDSPTTPLRKVSQEQERTPDSSNADSASCRSLYSSATEGNASSFKSPLSSVPHNQESPAGANEVTNEGTSEVKSEEQQVNQDLTRLNQALEATLADRDASISDLTSQVQTLRAAHESALNSLQNNHAAEIRFLHSLMGQFEKSSSEPYQYHSSPRTNTLSDSVPEANPHLVDEQVVEKAEEMASDSIIYPISSSETNPVHDHSEASIEHLHPFQAQEVHFCKQIDYYEAQLKGCHEDIFFHEQYASELRGMLEQQNDKISELEHEVRAQCNIITTIQNGPELRRALDQKDKKIYELECDLKASTTELEGQSSYFSMQVQMRDSRCNALLEENKNLKSAQAAQDHQIAQLHQDLHEYEGVTDSYRNQIDRLQNQIISKPVDINLSYSALSTPSPSPSCHRSGINRMAQDNDRDEDPFQANDDGLSTGRNLDKTQDGDPLTRIAELERQIKVHVEDIRLYKLDVRGYRKDIKKRDKKIEELRDGFLGLNAILATKYRNPGSLSESTPSSEIGLGIDVPKPLPLKTRPRAPVQALSPWINPSPDQDTLLSKFNASCDTSPVTPPSQTETVAELATRGSPVRKSRKPRTPKLPIISEQRESFTTH